MVKTIPFYLQAWVEDPFVQGLDLLTTGIYWKLLTFQAANNGIPDDESEISRVLDDDVSGVAMQIWYDQLEQKFPVDTDGKRRNKRMAAAVQFAEESYKRRAAQERIPPVELQNPHRFASSWQADDPTIQAILDCYPKRPNPREGHTKAAGILKALLRSESDVDLLISAIENYKTYLKTSMRGRPKAEIAQYTKKIDKWLEVWQDWVPAEAPKPSVTPPKSPVISQIPKFNSIDEECGWLRQNGRYVNYPPGSRFPWEPRYGALPHEIEAIKQHWTPERKAAWSMAESING